MHLRKRALVTGGAGFLGSHLCERLLDEGYDVLCADNFYTGSKRNISHLLGNPDFEFCRHEITLPLSVGVGGGGGAAAPAGEAQETVSSTVGTGARGGDSPVEKEMERGRPKMRAATSSSSGRYLSSNHSTWN